MTTRHSATRVVDPADRDCSDTISVTTRIACDAHTRGDLSSEDLIALLEKLIDARALENGYASRFGLPSEQGKPRPKGSRP